MGLDLRSIPINLLEEITKEVFCLMVNDIDNLRIRGFFPALYAVIGILPIALIMAPEKLETLVSLTFVITIAITAPKWIGIIMKKILPCGY